MYYIVNLFILLYFYFFMKNRKYKLPRYPKCTIPIIVSAVFTETIRAEGLEIKVMTYAHQRLVQLLVSEIHVTRTDGGSEEFILKVDRSPVNSTIDLAIDEPTVLTGLKGYRQFNARQCRSLISDNKM